MLWIVTKKVKCFAEPPDPVKLAIKVELNQRGITFRAQELCESGGGRPGLPSLIFRTVSVDVKQH